MDLKKRIDEKRRERERIELKIEEEKREREKLEERIQALNEKLDMIDKEKEELGLIASKVEAILDKMEKNRIHEYLDLIGSRKKLIYINILIGTARGLGTIIGAAVITAFLIYLLQKIVSLNIPVIGDFITEIVRRVQNNLQIVQNNLR